MKAQTKILREITARLKHTEQVLYASEDEYSTLVENADCIILRMDTKGNITFFNESALKLFYSIKRELARHNLVQAFLAP